MSDKIHTPIRSFMRRSGRMSDQRRQALETLQPRYTLQPEQLTDLDAVFGRHAPRHLEIGFGMGGTLLEMAHRHPAHDYVGVEVHLPGIARVLAGLEQAGLRNVRVVNADAVELLRHHLLPASLERVYVFFPDPWPKLRHHKRRLVQPEFTALLWRVLRPGGVLHLATDWDNYAQHMLAVLEAQTGLVNMAGPGQFHPRPSERPLTKFEQRGLRLGHGVWDLLYRRE